MPAQQKEINLLPIEEFEKTFLGRFLKWAFGVGRWIVVITDLVAILCFLSRIKLDRDLTDLGEKIKQQQAIIASFGDLEKNFRNLQKRLATIEKLEQEQVIKTALLEEISQKIPFDVSFSELTVQEGKIEIAGQSFSEEGLGNFIKAISDSSFQQITIEKVSQKETGEINFKLSAIFTEQK